MGMLGLRHQFRSQCKTSEAFGACRCEKQAKSYNKNILQLKSCTGDTSNSLPFTSLPIQELKHQSKIEIKAYIPSSPPGSI